MKTSATLLFLLFYTNVFAALSCQKYLLDNKLALFTEVPGDYAIINNSTVLQQKLHRDLRKIGVEIIKAYFNESSRVTVLDLISNPQKALVIIYKNLYGQTYETLVSMHSIAQGRQIIIVNSQKPELNLESRLIDIIDALSGNERLIKSFYEKEISAIIEDALNNVDTGLFQPRSGRY
jgi:hypothetical protein